jgi:hypothetical protein
VFVQVLRKKVPHPTRSALCVAGVTLALLGNNGASAAEDAGASSMVCPQRELLLMILLEAHGAAPNAASDKLAAESLGLMHARIACDSGKAREAIIFYDRLIAELTTALAQRDNKTSATLAENHRDCTP